MCNDAKTNENIKTEQIRTPGNSCCYIRFAIKILVFFL